jgi:UDPglucose 6-dehydrogenase
MAEPIQIAVVGSGYVGLVAAVCFAEMGHSVICVDNDESKVAALQGGDTLIHENHLPELLERYRNTRVRFMTDLGKRRGPARRSLWRLERRNRRPATLTFRMWRQLPARSRGRSTDTRSSSKRARFRCTPTSGFGGSSNATEFLGIRSTSSRIRSFCAKERRSRTSCIPTESLWALTASEPPNGAGCDLLALTGGEYYQQPSAIPGCCSQQNPPVLLQTSTKSAEIIKHASNAFLALKISFINAVSNLCEAADANVEQVARGMGLDSRIGPKFLRPGIGYGGSCFPKDIAAFRSVAEQMGVDFSLLSEVEKININQKKRFLSKVRSALWTLRGKRLAVLGLAFKGDTDDIRESPAIDLVEMLLAEGCTVVAYDPAAMARAEAKLPRSSQMQYANGVEEAARTRTRC